MFCQECKKKRCLKLGKPCRKVEKYLYQELNGSSQRQITRKEQPFDPYYLNEILPVQALDRLWGKKKLKSQDDENVHNK